MKEMSRTQGGTIEDYGIVIYKVYAGSRSYGTNITEEMAKAIAKEKGGKWEDYVSDVDIRGIFIPYPKYMFGAQKIDEFKDPNDEDTVYFSLEKFLRLALEGNPNVVEQLFVRDEDVLYMHLIGEELRKNRQWFISKNAYGRFGSYAWSQLKRMTVQNEEFKRNEKRQKIIDMTGENTGEKYDAKNAMHLVRLFQMGIQILREGTLSTFRPNVSELMKIRNGDYPLAEIYDYAERLNLELEEAMKHSTIPNVPDFEAVNKWAMNAVDRLFEKTPDVGIFQGTTLQILPVEYEMIDKTTMFLVSNPLVRRLSNSEALGMSIPYKDWFTGLRKFDEFKFDKTTIEFVHKFVSQVRSCNPRHMDTIFAPNERFLHKHPMTDEFLTIMRKLPTTKRAYHTAKGYVTGNLKRMEHWEQLKAKHEEFKQDVQEAKKLKKSDWEERLEALEGRRNELGNKFRDEKDKLIRQYQRWQELSQKKGNLPLYPDIPSKTPNENASAMGKFSYDTILASELYHVSMLFIELLKTGTIDNSRAYEEEMYAIKHGKFRTFHEFKEVIETLLNDLDLASQHAQLGTHNYEEVQEWLIDFIQRYQQTL